MTIKAQVGPAGEGDEGGRMFERGVTVGAGGVPGGGPRQDQAEDVAGASLDTGVREFRIARHSARVWPGDTWVTISGRGGDLTMACSEIPGVLRLIREAADYAEGKRP